MLAKFSAFAAFLALLLQPTSAVAGTITFFDSTDTVTVVLSADLLMRGSAASCSGEICRVVLISPLGTAGVNFSSTNIFDPNSQILSDTIFIDFPIFPTALITFTSDSEGGPALQPVNGPFIFENGMVQFASSIVWHLAAGGDITDSIFFQSDAVEISVPEPGTLALLGLALVGFGSIRRMPD
jgi:hypothetical protein